MNDQSNDLNEVQSIDAEINALQEKKKRLLDAKRTDALKQAKELVRTFGFTASELGLLAASGEASTAKPSKKREAKYANPSNPGQTWGGGARPKWVQAHLDNGGTLEDLLIKR